MQRVCIWDAEQFNVARVYACLPLCVYACDAADSTDDEDVRQSRYLFLSFSILSLLAKVLEVLPCSPED